MALSHLVFEILTTHYSSFSFSLLLTVRYGSMLLCCSAARGVDPYGLGGRGLIAAIVIAALWNRAGHYIFALWFLSFFLFFHHLISTAVDRMPTILPHMVWP